MAKTVTLAGDRSFDDLAERFSANIYGTRKGRLRLDVVAADFAHHLQLHLPAAAGEVEADAEPRAAHGGGGAAGEIPSAAIADSLPAPYDESLHAAAAAAAAAAATTAPFAESARPAGDRGAGEGATGRRLLVLDAGGGIGQISAQLAAQVRLPFLT